MIKALLFDFSRVLLFSKDENYTGSLNEKYRQLSQENNYKLLDHFILNEELLDFLKSLKEKYDLYMLTTETIQDNPEILPDLEPIFNKVFSGIKLGLNKKEQDSYKFIAKDLNLSTNEILFIDDTLVNLEAAKQAGFETIQYKNNEQIIQELKLRLQ